jgi:hypothetical protein
MPSTPCRLQAASGAPAASASRPSGGRPNEGPLGDRQRCRPLRTFSELEDVSRGAPLGGRDAVGRSRVRSSARTPGGLQHRLHGLAATSPSHPDAQPRRDRSRQLPPASGRTPSDGLFPPKVWFRVRSSATGQPPPSRKCAHVGRAIQKCTSLTTDVNDHQLRGAYGTHDDGNPCQTSTDRFRPPEHAKRRQRLVAYSSRDKAQR